MAAHGQATVAAVLVAGGSGTRLGSTSPKAFVPVAGRTLLQHACDRLLGDPRIATAVVVVPAGWEHAARAMTDRDVVPGGATRQASVQAGLAALGTGAEFVLVHDVARPFVPRAVVDRVLAALDSGADAAIPAQAVTDTIKRVDASGYVLATLDRSELVAVQTPQGFRRTALDAAHTAGTGLAATDDAALVEAAGGKVVVVDGAREAVKITHPEDLVLAEWLAARD